MRYSTIQQYLDFIIDNKEMGASPIDWHGEDSLYGELHVDMVYIMINIWILVK